MIVVKMCKSEPNLVILLNFGEFSDRLEQLKYLQKNVDNLFKWKQPTYKNF